MPIAIEKGEMPSIFFLPLEEDLDVVGPIELQLDAACTAPDTALMAVLEDVDLRGKETIVTAG